MSNNVILIPARSGSSRIKNKNIRQLNSKPLLYYIINTAIKSKSGTVYLSTDSDDYSQLAKEYGARIPYLRSKILSTSKAPSSWVILDFLNWYKHHNDDMPEFITFCPPTNPLLKSKTIRSMLEKLVKNNNFNSIVTYSEPSTHPFKIINIDKSGKLVNGYIKINGKTINDYERSQDFPSCYEGSPACRITRTSFFLNLLDKEKNISKIDYNKTYDPNRCLGFKISREEAIDIDNEADLKIAEVFANNKG